MTINHRLGDVGAVGVATRAASLCRGRRFGAGQTMQTVESNVIRADSAAGSSWVLMGFDRVTRTRKAVRATHIGELKYILLPRNSAGCN